VLRPQSASLHCDAGAFEATPVAAPSVTESPAPAVTGGGVAVYVTATVTGSGPAPTGTVTFFACDGLAGPAGCPTGGTQVGSPVALTAAGAHAATATVAAPAPTHGYACVRAAYAGDYPSASDTTADGCFAVYDRIVTGKVGSVTVPAGLSVLIDGATVAGQVRASRAAGVVSCGSKIAGSVSISGSTGFVEVGGPGCAGNTIRGGVSLSADHDQAEVVGNTIGGVLDVVTETGPGPGPANTATVIGANHVGGVLSCAANTPAPVDNGQPNTSGGRSGQCSAPGF
jgi:hypothetical protein